jgi:NAD(P)-dependent dehydrogenase (short-subunit alcohol dehydrogenase family)
MVDRAALVTGASRGIGERIAGYLAGAGYGVSMVGRGLDGELDRAAGRLATDGRDVQAIAADLRDEAAVADVVRQHRARYGDRVDVLVHSAGLLAVGPVADLATEALDDLFAVNVRAGFLLVRDTLPLLRAAENPLVLLLGSMAGLNGTANLAAYAASKFAVVGLAESLALELAPQGIRVTALCPDRVASTEDLAGEPDLIGLSDVTRAVATLVELSPAVSVPVLPLRLARP